MGRYMRGPFLAVVLTFSIAAAYAGRDGPAPQDATTIAAADLYTRLFAEGAPLILDVRSAQEYCSGHVPGAVHIPHDRLLGFLAQLQVAKHREIVVYCELGGRAGRCAGQLRDAGFTNVRLLEGDMRGWREAGYLASPLR